MPVHKIALSCLPKLREKFILDIPRSITLMGSITNVLNRKLQANFYVDQWPNFSALVAQLIWPRLSDVADICAYATSSEALLSVLTEGNLVTWGKRQEFQAIEDKHADFLIKNIKCPASASDVHDKFNVLECTYHAVPYYYGLDDTRDKKIECPEGFFIDKLQPEHAKYISSVWTYNLGWPHREAYLEYIVKHYETRALYTVQDPQTPISWIGQTPTGKIAFGYMKEEYRHRGLYSILKNDMCQSILLAGYVVPESDVVGVIPSSKTNADLKIVRFDFDVQYLELK